MLSPDPMINGGVLAFWVVFLPLVALYCRQIYIANRNTPAPTEPEQVDLQTVPPIADTQRVLDHARTIRLPLSCKQQRELLTFAIALCGIGKLAQHPVFKAMRSTHAKELRLFTAAFSDRLVARFAGIHLPIDYTDADGRLDFTTEDDRTAGVINKVLDNPELTKVLCGICSICNWELVSVYRDYCEQPGRPQQFSLIETGVFDALFRHAGVPAA